MTVGKRKNKTNGYSRLPGDAKTYLQQWREVNEVKKDIQPKYYMANIKCNCGNEFQAGSTNENIHVEVCSKCHPFYTGSQKLLLDAGGRVDKFKKKYNI